MCKIYSEKKINQLSEILIRILHDSKIDFDHFLENINCIQTQTFIIGFSERWHNTKKYRVSKFQIGSMYFRIKRQDAKRIKLHPWHKYEFGVYRYNYHNKETEQYLFTRIVFMTQTVKRNRKKFEMKTFLRLLWKIKHSNLIEIEKFLFEVTA